MGSQLAPPLFFQYTSVTGEERRNWAERLLLRHEIYFRARAQLNDPAELRPIVSVVGEGSELRKYAHAVARKHAPQLSPSRRLLRVNQQIERHRRDPQLLQRALYGILDGCGVLSVSAAPNIKLLWAHYAQGHRGICFAFNSGSGLFRAAQPVEYGSERPVVNRLRDSNDALLQKTFFLKGAEWAYEAEWRVIAQPADSADPTLAARLPADLGAFQASQRGPGYYSIPPDALRAIIVGASADPATVVWLEEVLGRREYAIPLHRAEIAADGSLGVVP